MRRRPPLIALTGEPGAPYSEILSGDSSGANFEPPFPRKCSQSRHLLPVGACGLLFSFIALTVKFDI